MVNFQLRHSRCMKMSSARRAESKVSNRVRSVVDRLESFTMRLPRFLRWPGKLTVSFARSTLRSVVGVESKDGVVALTFDDGPDPIYTPAILDVLQSMGGRATFFILCDQADKHPDLVARIVDEGHEVALHTCSHRDLTGLSMGGLLREIYAARRSLRMLSGSDVKLFRPPYGAQNLRSYLMSRISGMLPVLWDTTASDWEDVTTDQVVDSALGSLSDGGILLLHDGHTDPEHNTTAPTYDKAKAVDRILVGLAESGIKSTTVTELLEGRTPRNRLWFETDSAARA